MYIYGMNSFYYDTGKSYDLSLLVGYGVRNYYPNTVSNYIRKLHYCYMQCCHCVNKTHVFIFKSTFTKNIWFSAVVHISVNYNEI